MVEKNKEYEIEITGMGHEGEGVGKVDNFTVFVQGAILGERVRAKIVKAAKTYAHGKLMEVIDKSKYRTEPDCSTNKTCGGCQLQHLSYEGQLFFKKLRVQDALKRIGKLEDVTVHEVLGMKDPYRYRNKVQLPVGMKNGEVRIGFYLPRSHDIVDMETCCIQDESADKVIAIVRQWIKEYKIKPYDEETHSGIVRHIMVRKAFRTGEIMVVVVTNGRELPNGKELIEILCSQMEGLTGIIQNINSKKTNVILGDENITLWGKDTISDYIGEFKFNISPMSFFQVNPLQTEVLYGKALEYAGLTGEETVFDAYCGTGTISLFLSQRAKKVYGVEIVPEAIENAKVNAVQNKIDNTEFIVGKSEEEIPKLIAAGVKADVVVVDPPRKGCEKELLEAISSMSPRRIVYVSCDPGTLARDLGILEELGYKTLEVQPVDMFPQTAHVECVARIEKMAAI